MVARKFRVQHLQYPYDQIDRQEVGNQWRSNGDLVVTTFDFLFVCLQVVANLVCLRSKRNMNMCAHGRKLSVPEV